MEEFNWTQRIVELKEATPGIFMDVSSLNDFVDINRKGWISPLYDFRLKNYAEYLGRRRDFNVLISPLSSRAYLFSHQLAVTSTVIQKMGGRSILADEVGLGKTIESGMIMKELLLRNLVNRVLILVPASLVTQWQEEMRHRFNEHFVIYDTDKRKELEEKYGDDKNIWELETRILASLHVAKQRRYREQIQKIPWDLVIVDEAHRLKNSATQNHKLVQGLKTKYLLLLTATPLQNYLIELYNLVSLVDKELLGAKSGFKRRFEDHSQDPVVLEKLKKRLRRVMIRNRRCDIGSALSFGKRHALTLQVELDEPNRTLYNLASRYALEGYRKSIAAKNSTYAFFLMLVQRMLTSSTSALEKTLQKRLEMLQEVKQGKRKSIRLRDFIAQELEVRAIEEEVVEDDSFLSTLDEEIKEIQKILQIIPKVVTHPKLNILVEMLDRIYQESMDAKVVIFTEFRSTQDFLGVALKEKGFDVEVFHGGLSLREKDAAVERFEEEGQILISTEAGSEGQNLQFSHIVVNYDLPWNPMKVEQRIGRVHRIGQTQDVQIINFSTRDTVEEYLLRILEHKIGLFKEVMGDLETILGYVAGDTSFEQLLMDLLAKNYSENGIRFDEVFQNLEARIEAAQKEADLSLLTDLSQRGMNLSLKDLFPHFEQYTPGREEIFYRRFMDEYLDKYNALTDKSDEYIAFNVPGHQAHSFIFSDFIRGTVNREIALAKPYLEFIGIGHKFVDAAIRESRNLLPVSVGKISRDLLMDYGIYNPGNQGILASFLSELRWTNGGEERFFTAFTDGNETVILEGLEEPLMYLDELPPHFCSDLPLELFLDKILKKLREKLVEERQQLFNQRNKEAEEIRTYISDYYSDLRYDIELQLEKVQMESLQIRKKRQRVEWSEEENLASRETSLKRLRNELFAEMVKLNAREKEKIREIEKNLGITVHAKLLSIAKVRIF